MWNPVVLGLALLAAGGNSNDLPSATGKLAAATAVVSDQGVPLVSAQVPTLRETLEKGLRARRPDEFQYIDRIVTLVEQGVLPLPLVLSTFNWARKQHDVYPFVYFKLGLRERAGRMGITL